MQYRFLLASLLSGSLAACSRAGSRTVSDLPVAQVAGESRAATSPYWTDRCPIPPGVEGYAVVARADDSTFRDTAYLRRVVHRVVHRWAPPHRSGPEPDWPPPGLAREPEHELPHEVELWSEWTPGASDTATAKVTVGRDGMIWDFRLLSRPADRAFANSLAEIADRLREPCRGRDCPGALPAGARADSIAVTLRFGARPASDEPAVRWAAQGLAPWPRPRNPAPEYPMTLRSAGVSGGVVLAFVIDTTGRADMGTIEVLYAAHPRFVSAVRDVLRRSSYRPAEANCQKRAWSVMQAFRFLLSW